MLMRSFSFYKEIQAHQPVLIQTMCSAIFCISLDYIYCVYDLIEEINELKTSIRWIHLISKLYCPLYYYRSISISQSEQVLTYSKCKY